MSSAAAQAATRYQRTFPGHPGQVAQVRRDITAHLDGCPAADDAVLIASELAANAVTHSASAGEFFTIRCEAHTGYVQVECEDLGGPWHCRRPDDRPHGLDLIEALAGPDTGEPKPPATMPASSGPGWACLRRKAPCVSTTSPAKGRTV